MNYSLGLIIYSINFYLTGVIPEPGKNIDILGHVANLVTTTFGLYPHFATVFFLHTEMDPISQFYRFLLPKSRLLYFIIMLLLRPTFIWVTFLQISRFFTMVFCICTIAERLVLDRISEMNRTIGKYWTSRYEVLKNHDILQILLQYSSDLTTNLVGIIKFGGLILSVAFNYVTLSMFDVIPMRLYLAFAIVSALLPIIIESMLPPLVDVYEEEVKLHWRLGRSLHLPWTWKFLTKRVKAARILRVYCGIMQYNFYHLKKSTKVRYWFIILNYTISALLARRGKR